MDPCAEQAIARAILELEVDLDEARSALDRVQRAVAMGCERCRAERRAGEPEPEKSAGSR